MSAAGILRSSGLACAAARPGMLRSAREKLLKRFSGKRSPGPSRSSDDLKYVERVRGGDREAFRYLVDKYRERAYSIAFSVVRSREDAEDVVQEAFVKAYLSLKDFRGDSAFYTWLYRIVYNMAVDLKRRKARNTTIPLNGNSDDDSETVGESAAVSKAAAQLSRLAAPDEAVSRREQSERIRQALMELSDEHRAVILLREVEGLAYDEIARTVGVSKGTVMSRLHYARKRMQRELGEIVPFDVHQGQIDLNNEAVTDAKKVSES